MRAALARNASALLVVCLGMVLAACNAGASSTAVGHASNHNGSAGGGTGGLGGSTSRSGSASGGSTSHGAPARDTFLASIVSGTGAYSGASGRVRISLHPRGSGRRRTTRMAFQPACRRTHGCKTRLKGTLRGTLTAAGRHLPDTGSQDTLTGGGRISPLGNARARGWVQGTGFIAHGHELMRITLTTSSGSITLQGRSAAVKGFSSP